MNVYDGETQGAMAVLSLGARSVWRRSCLPGDVTSDVENCTYSLGLGKYCRNIHMFDIIRILMAEPSSHSCVNEKAIQDKH